MEQSKKSSNKITEIVRLQQMIKKWKKLSVEPNKSTSSSTSSTSSSSKAKKFLKRTLSFTDSAAGPPAMPRGHLAVCVGADMRRFVIPTEYLKHRAFAALLREAEEEFGFQQEGVLRIPCEVSVFESILKAVEKNKDGFFYCSYEVDEVAQVGHSTPNPMCR